ncbi:alpha-D-ribose 1-methylphosphonate 5-phosphate C-P-lyase PhnJ [Frankia sp. CNm7]|nr:alpha-D-ribose 1-methylphosphonate 5-phosphate C-P-lyase PhnJ [Frankia nepalensis]MBL7512665.1 alpha-D-ribose 1-methylphosphonate 5-phosphate C-P-lyase PhnJ [Frankia nepalensis]MBL7523190.1 alpha-D-ribose 1-methylphosphonate 5-phosphate C-P-lyase PhnJ [Frankia nepalensis]
MSGYLWAYLDAATKREIRRALLKAVCVPGHITPFASREMPVARGWGSGGLQITLATVVADDVVKVIDQGDDDSLNARTMRALIADCSGVATTTDARAATLIQTRHRIPEDDLGDQVVLVFQVPISDPLREFEQRPMAARRMHAERDYAAIWLGLYEDHSRLNRSRFAHSYPCEVEGGYIVSSTPIPRFDVPRLHQAPFLSLFGAGREAAVYAIPPYTDVVPITFTDRPFETEAFDGPCASCGSTGSYLTEAVVDGHPALVCSDTDRCRRRQAEEAAR